MQIGMITDSLGHLDFDTLLQTAATLGLEMLEFSCGNWSSAPHIRLDELLERPAARVELLAKVKDHGLTLSALNCSGNPLAPGEPGRRHDAVTRKTLQLAKLLGLHRVVLMSGLPSGGPEDRVPNWIITAWPPEGAAILRWQWDEVAIPYWREMASFAHAQGITQLCFEMHGAQLVYNTETLLRLRDAAGEVIGANFDPSHLLWMGGDPLAAIRRLDGAIYHVHAKDTRIDPLNAGVNTLIETKPNARAAERSWNYVTLGYGQDEAWWRQFVLALRTVGYDGVLSIEHEDFLMDPVEGVRKSVELLQRVIMRAPPSYQQ